MSLDRFSAQAAQYARYRIDYPPELYAWLLPQVGGRSRAWDCATGNGQVAVVLAQYFREVEATDLSGSQLAEAPALPNVRYQVATAEHTPFPDEHFDLITVAQAVHWFDLAKYHAEVRRVAGPGTVLAEWGYGLVQTGEPALDALILHFHNETVGPYWDANRWHVLDAYARLQFPFAKVHRAYFEVRKEWSAAWFLDYLRTWSAVANYGRQHAGADAVLLVAEELTQKWGVGERTVVFPVFARTGVVH
ncbi:methyltransferase domain-containing protein [Hymenobacter sp. HMF4947]|uniref:Methyltransferase domain-containing protein n=1 Tax=Hymenobacter ginkgonis TaxID=2682976 RepID=A0A7K1TAE1_9BACT|nr:class I SAM-dependent methyltransferase [Hymenobacter ginkgonis]MVN75272.1 methyltransferase domain-containing protein [Hymenobacter ginkgonis]